MDPKSLAGKPPSFDPLTPEFGARVSEWILGDMRRAKKAREEKAKKAGETPKVGETPKGDTPPAKCAR